MRVCTRGGCHIGAAPGPPGAFVIGEREDGDRKPQRTDDDDKTVKSAIRRTGNGPAFCGVRSSREQ